GCKTLVRLPHTKGIGHIDESVKFVDDNTLLVDDQDYADTLAAKGFKVIKMVRPSNDYETYVNALVVNGTAFLPVFNQKSDVAAIEIYEKLGLKVVPLNSISLSNDGLGSIHCITMSYPPVPFNELLKHIGAEAIN
ncbi:MAG: agmatine deiminase family protein, partial [Bdellovibrionaceae bacterium]|nr:agmatine deiminase family protein [Pseudobdellovibrionaceae bacterium]